MEHWLNIVTSRRRPKPARPVLSPLLEPWALPLEQPSYSQARPVHPLVEDPKVDPTGMGKITPVHLSLAISSLTP